VDFLTLRAKDNLPELRKEISREAPNPRWHEGSDDEPEQISIRENLADHPKVKAVWSGYVEQQWLPWTDRHCAWENVNKVYTKLFVIHQAQLKLEQNLS